MRFNRYFKRYLSTNHKKFYGRGTRFKHVIHALWHRTVILIAEYGLKNIGLKSSILVINDSGVYLCGDFRIAVWDLLVAGDSVDQDILGMFDDSYIVVQMDEDKGFRLYITFEKLLLTNPAMGDFRKLCSCNMLFLQSRRVPLRFGEWTYRQNLVITTFDMANHS